MRDNPVLDGINSIPDGNTDEKIALFGGKKPKTAAAAPKKPAEGKVAKRVREINAIEAASKAENAKLI